jgi:superfamily II DNA/RNA helicase
MVFPRFYALLPSSWYVFSLLSTKFIRGTMSEVLPLAGISEINPKIIQRVEVCAEHKKFQKLLKFLANLWSKQGQEKQESGEEKIEFGGSETRGGRGRGRGEHGGERKKFGDKFILRTKIIIFVNTIRNVKIVTDCLLKGRKYDLILSLHGTFFSLCSCSLGFNLFRNKRTIRKRRNC